MTTIWLTRSSWPRSSKYFWTNMIWDTISPLFKSRCFWSNQKHRRYNRYCIPPESLHRQIIHSADASRRFQSTCRLAIQKVLDRSICWLLHDPLLEWVDDKLIIQLRNQVLRKIGHFFEGLDAFAIEPFQICAARNFFSPFSSAQSIISWRVKL